MFYGPKELYSSFLRTATFQPSLLSSISQAKTLNDSSKPIDQLMKIVIHPIFEKTEKKETHGES